MKLLVVEQPMVARRKGRGCTTIMQREATKGFSNLHAQAFGCEQPPDLRSILAS